jgi:hypothetical protein
MSIHLNYEESGKLLVARIDGKLTKEDYQHFASEFEKHLRGHEQLNVLVDMNGFDSLEAGAVWEEVKFDVKHFADIDRLAAVGDKRWQHIATTLFSPFTKATIRYFDHSIVVAEARKWLDAA